MKNKMNNSSTFLLQLCICLIFCVVAGSLYEQHNISIGNGDSSLPPNKSQCNLSVERTSAEHLPRIIEGLQIKLLQMTLAFKPYTNVSHTEQAIQPLKWFWSYNPLKGSYPYFQWPWDISILSLGLLDTHFTKYTIYFDVTPDNCFFNIGSRSTNFAIAEALSIMTTTYLTGVKQYNYSYWCYMEEFPGAKDTLAYTMGRYIGYPTEFVGYRCCKFKFNSPSHKRYLKCYATPKPQWQPMRVIPFVLSIILLLYSPLFLMRMATYMSRSCYSKEDTFRHGYQNIDVGENETENETYVVLNNNCPVSVCEIFCGFGGLIEIYPVVISRLRRFIFLLLAPVLVYGKILAHFYLQPELSMELIRHGAPVGFVSVMAGIEESRKVFLTNLGGPCMVLLCYYILGFIIIVIPRDISAILEDGIFEKSTLIPSSMFRLDLDTIRNISLVNFSTLFGYKKVQSVLTAQCLMLLRFKYWNLVLNIQVQRWRVWSCHLLPIVGYSQILYIFLKIFAFVVYFLICVLEITVSTIFYALPIFNFIIYAIHGFARNLWIHISRLENQSSRTLCGKVSSFSGKCMFSVCIIYFVICFCEIIMASVSFFAEIICFTYMSAMIFPDDVYGYLFFGAGFIYYVCNCLTKFGIGYHELLNDTITICKTLQQEPCGFKIDKNSLILSHFSETVTEIKVDDTVMKLSPEQQELINNRHEDYQRRYVRYFNVRPAIQKSLFHHVIQKYRPLHIHLFSALLELAFIFVLVIMSLTVLNIFSFTRDTSGVIKVLSILVIGMLPQIVKSISQDKHRGIEQADRRAHIEQTIMEYFQMITFTQRTSKTIQESFESIN